MVDYALFEYLPFDCSQSNPGGSASDFDVTEILFGRALTEDEQDIVNEEVPDVHPTDWRDDQTLWIWESQEELDRWLDHLNVSFTR